MNLGLTNKVYIVSGGSEGIGEAITRTLVEEGAKVMIVTLAETPTIELAKELNVEVQKVHYILGKLPDLDLSKRTIEEAIKVFGRIDGVVNNAGVNDGASLEKGPEAFRASVKLNLFHCFDLVHYALDELKKHKGAIINIASKVALTGQGGTSGYAAAKGAILGLTREWAADLLPYQIRVNAILPAEVMTGLYQQWLSGFEDPQAAEEKVKAKIPLEHRMTSRAEIAATAAFLLSDKSGHTTGQFVHPDGGYVHLDRRLT